MICEEEMSGRDVYDFIKSRLRLVEETDGSISRVSRGLKRRDIIFVSAIYQGNEAAFNGQLSRGMAVVWRRKADSWAMLNRDTHEEGGGRVMSSHRSRLGFVYLNSRS